MSNALPTESPKVASPVASEGFAHRRVMLPVVLVAMFMAQFDLYVVNVALPVLQHELSASDAELQLVVGGYAFTYAAGLVTGGRLGDHYGHGRMFTVGMSLFGVASLACGLAPGSGWLVAFRLIQGLTAALMVPQVLALITSAFPPAERPKALSWFGVTMGVGAVAGQVLGGVLLQISAGTNGWRTIFLINVPIAIVTILIGRKNLPTAARKAVSRFDLTGVGLLTLSLALILFPLVVGRAAGWPWWASALLILALPTIAATLWWERRVERTGQAPILPLELFREKAFNLGLGISVVLFSAFFSFVFCLTLVLQNGLGLTPLMAGLTFGPLGVAFAVASMAARPYIARHGAKVIVVGALIVAAGLLALELLLAYSNDAPTAWELAIPMAVVGFGNGTAVPAVIGQVLARIKPVRAGAASGILTTAQQFSSALGIAIIGGVFLLELSTRFTLAAHASALGVAAWWDTGLVAVGLALSLLLAGTTKAPKG
ncbi:MFS transporter [Paenarthrobacter sp. NPDC089675]|uniref:MFS transporter n=1 Tax=Paenarthrobacter sp. NPDC089675 TaxID=3364376 RepID=UPI00380BFA79